MGNNTFPIPPRIKGGVSHACMTRVNRLHVGHGAVEPAARKAVVPEEEREEEEGHLSACEPREILAGRTDNKEVK